MRPADVLLELWSITFGATESYSRLSNPLGGGAQFRAAS
jgi:hypothetical protein